MFTCSDVWMCNERDLVQWSMQPMIQLLPQMVSLNDTDHPSERSDCRNRTNCTNFQIADLRSRIRRLVSQDVYCVGGGWTTFGRGVIPLPGWLGEQILIPDTYIPPPSLVGNADAPSKSVLGIAYFNTVLIRSASSQVTETSQEALFIGCKPEASQSFQLPTWLRENLQLPNSFPRIRAWLSPRFHSSAQNVNNLWILAAILNTVDLRIRRSRYDRVTVSHTQNTTEQWDSSAIW